MNCQTSSPDEAVFKTLYYSVKPMGLIDKPKELKVVISLKSSITAVVSLKYHFNGVTRLPVCSISTVSPKFLFFLMLIVRPDLSGVLWI